MGGGYVGVCSLRGGFKPRGGFLSVEPPDPFSCIKPYVGAVVYARIIGV